MGKSVVPRFFMYHGVYIFIQKVGYGSCYIRNESLRSDENTKLLRLL